MRENLLQLLNQRPFQPLTLRLSNGSPCRRHREMAMVSPSYVIIGIPPQQGAGHEISDSAIVSLIHIVQVDMQAAAASGSPSR